MKRSVIIFLPVLILISFVSSAFAVIDVSESELDSGKSVVFAPGDKAKMTMNGKEVFLQIISLYEKSVQVWVSENKRQFVGNADSGYPNEIKFEIDYDNFYDLSVSVTDISWGNSPNITQTTTLLLKKIHEQVPEDAKSTYSCYKTYTCPNGKVIGQCEAISSEVDAKCRCRTVLESECELDDQQPQETEQENETEIDDKNKTKENETEVENENKEQNREKNKKRLVGYIQ